MTKYSQDKTKIQNFIEKRLTKTLKKDQKSFKILSEGDLQACVYYHIRKFITKNKIKDWYIINKLPMGEKVESKKFPDIAIVYSKEKGQKVYPSFLIELKEDYRNFKLTRIVHDLKKLTALTKKHKHNLEQTYFIYAVLDKKHTPKQINEIITENIPNRQNGYLVPITINIIGEKHYPSEIENFEKQVQKLRKLRSG